MLWQTITPGVRPIRQLKWKPLSTLADEGIMSRACPTQSNVKLRILNPKSVRLASLKGLNIVALDEVRGRENHQANNPEGVEH
jgi:hypothetical protein